MRSAMSTPLSPDSQSARLLAEAELDAERLVAAVRVFVASMLAAAFAVSVTPWAPDDPLLSRQILMAQLTMAGYFAMGVLALALAWRALLRRWMVWAFATADVGFVLASVALSLANTGLLPNFAPALPAVWLAPLVLAFGALRYNPWLQAWVVALLVVGLPLAAWTAGGWAVVRGTTEPAALGLLFDVPPAVMRLVMIALAGMLLVLAARRARGLLARAVSEARRRANLVRFLPVELAGALEEASGEALHAGRRQPVAILFLDIRAFTAFAEDRPPAELGAFLGEFRGLVLDAVERHGGVVDKFIADGALVVFGVPEAREDDAARCLACLRDLMTAFAGWRGGGVRVGFGAHWGEVFVGAVGDDRRLEFTVLGDAVNIAARLQEETKSVGTAALVSRDLVAAAGGVPDGLSIDPLPDRVLRGRAHPVALFAARAD